MWLVPLGLMGVFAQAGEESVQGDKEVVPRAWKEERGRQRWPCCSSVTAAKYYRMCLCA